MRRPVAILHAYDARNRGDGLLVSETLGFLERAGINQSDCVIVACNASSFHFANAAVQYPSFDESGYRKLSGSPALALLAAGSLWKGKLGGFTDVGRLVNSAGLIIGVGGGYLRAPGGRESLGIQLIHAPQLAMAAYAKCPTLYMPQSIGPLLGPIGNGIRRNVHRLDVVLARDQRTIEEVRGPNLERFPDLAILKIGRDLHGINRSSGGAVAGMARDLDSEGYRARIRELGTLMPITWLAHSSAEKNDDGKFYESAGLAYQGTSDQALDSRHIGVVISVRLHGALQAILAGIPAIHLSYERKGPGAYSDLGLLDWLHSARTFSPELVAKQAEELVHDSTEYWARVDRARDRLIDMDNRLVEKVKELRALS